LTVFVPATGLSAGLLSAWGPDFSAFFSCLRKGKAAFWAILPKTAQVKKEVKDKVKEGYRAVDNPLNPFKNNDLQKHRRGSSVVLPGVISRSAGGHQSYTRGSKVVWRG
jgi:hypothetical protein